MKKLYLFILGLVATVALNAQVTVTAPSLTISSCAFSTGYNALGNIVITETAVNDISGTGTFVLTAPTNFQFQTPGSVTATSTGGDLSIGAVAMSATTITFTITVNSITNFDVITISGVQVRGLVGPSGPSNIVRTASVGPAIVSGDAAGGGITHGTLTSQSTAAAAPVATGATSITCAPGGFTANWGTSTNSTTYRLDISTDVAFGSFVANYNNRNVGNVTSYATSIVGALAPGTYYYRIKGNNATCANGSASNIITVVIPSPAAIPTANGGSGTSCNQITAN